MKRFIKNKKNQIKAIYCVALIIAVVALLMTIPAQASEMDDRIESSARQSYLFKTYLQGDDIKIQSQNGAVTLTGVVAEIFHKALAQENVACLPGVKSVDNRLEVKDAPPHNKLGCMAP
jgi:hyperosmotically inducible periplasmic protein